MLWREFLSEEAMVLKDSAGNVTGPKASNDITKKNKAKLLRPGEKKKGVENILEKDAERGRGNGEKSELGGVRAVRLQDWASSSA